MYPPATSKLPVLLLLPYIMLKVLYVPEDILCTFNKKPVQATRAPGGWTGDIINVPVYGSLGVESG